MALRRAGPHLFLLLASLLASSPVLMLPGWPSNHDGVACFQRVEIFRRSFADGVLIPLWTPLAENGLGSPFPFFYHRLFNSLAGGAALVTGSSLSAVKLMIPLLLFAGALGMRKAILAMGLDSFLAVSGALLLVFSNYAYADWVVRGAFAEFAAFMLVPWLTVAALGVVLGKPRAGWVLGAVLALIFFAHSVVFVFSFAFVLVAFLGALVLSKAPRRCLVHAGQAALVVLVAAGPHVLGLWLFGKDVDLDRFRAGMFSVFRNFVPLGEYLYDRGSGWAPGAGGLSVEIGRGFNTLAVLGAVAVAAGLVRRRLPAARFRETLPAWFLVLGSALCSLFLQTPLAAPLYRLAPPLQYIQFPWRLLVFSTPASIFVLCLSTDLLLAGASRPSIRWGLRGVLTLAVLFQIWRGVGPRRVGRILSVTEIEESLTTERLAAASHSGEFRPRGIPRSPARPFLEEVGCAVEDRARIAALQRAVAVPRLRLSVDAEPGGMLEINQFANPFLAVSADRGGRVETTERGTLRVRLPAGRSEVALRRVGLLEALRNRLFGIRP
ncbi:MAG TPA: hypothetical protein VGM13_01065 [Thermoanaerobaculia bacterium]